jgi:hypothetical protein
MTTVIAAHISEEFKTGKNKTIILSFEEILDGSQKKIYQKKNLFEKRDKTY